MSLTKRLLEKVQEEHQKDDRVFDKDFFVPNNKAGWKLVYDDDQKEVLEELYKIKEYLEEKEKEDVDKEEEV